MMFIIIKGVGLFMAINLTMGERLDDLIKKSGKSAEAIAKEISKNGLKMSKATISDLINDVDKGYNYKYIVELAKYFNVSTDYLLCLTNHYSKLKSNEDNIKRITCDYLGLSEDTIKMFIQYQKYTALSGDFDQENYFSFSDDYGWKAIADNYKIVLDDFLSSPEFKEIITNLAMLVTIKTAIKSFKEISSDNNKITKIKHNIKNIKYCKEAFLRTTKYYKKEQKYNIYALMDSIKNYAKKYKVSNDITAEERYEIYKIICSLEKLDTSENERYKDE